MAPTATGAGAACCCEAVASRRLADGCCGVSARPLLVAFHCALTVQECGQADVHAHAGLSHTLWPDGDAQAHRLVRLSGEGGCWGLQLDASVYGCSKQNEAGVVGAASWTAEGLPLPDASPMPPCLPASAWATWAS